MELEFPHADGSAREGFAENLASIGLRGIVSDRADESFGAPCHFFFRAILIFGYGEQDGMGDAATFHVGEAIVGFLAEVQVSIEDGAAPFVSCWLSGE